MCISAVFLESGGLRSDFSPNLSQNSQKTTEMSRKLKKHVLYQYLSTDTSVMPIIGHRYLKQSALWAGLRDLELYRVEKGWEISQKMSKSAPNLHKQT